MRLQNYFLWLTAIFWTKSAAATCAVDESTNAARCFSLKEVEKLDSRSEQITNLEVTCLDPVQDFNISWHFTNLTLFSVKNCSNTIEIVSNIVKNASELKVLDLSQNNVSSLPWQLMSHSFIELLNLTGNQLACDCSNAWIFENIRKNKVSGWDSHFVVGLPSKIKVDPDFWRCDFSNCDHEEIKAVSSTKNLSLGQELELSCQLSRFSTLKPLNHSFGEWFWIFKETTTNSSVESRHLESWNSSGFLTIQIQGLTAQELGYLACICVQCVRPVFDIFELKFETDLTAALIEDSGETHLVVHGYPVDQLTIQIVRLTDNATEIEAVSEDKMFFFNDSLIFKYQRDLSHFFAKYFTIFVQECVLCPPRLSHHVDGDYSIHVCRQNRCASAVGQFINANPLHPVIRTQTSFQEKSEGSFLVVTVVLALLVLALLVLVSKTHLKHKLLKKGWELKRRASRNTDRTEETSIRLDDYSASSSLNYIVQHVALIDKNSLQIKEKIGKGAFGEVYQADWVQTDRTVAVAMKMLFGVQLDSELDKEAALLSQLDHPNIVKLYGVCRWDTQIALVMEMMNLGDLKTYVRERTPRCDNYSQFPAPLLQTELLNISAQVAAGLCYLTSQQIIHRDLAARNCLVQGESDAKVCNAAFRKPISVKISDFGMSRRLYSDGEYYKMQNGKTVLPVRWLPPECLSSGKFTHQSDVWSFGMVLFEIFSYGGVPFGDLSNSEVLTAVVSGMKPTLPSSFPEPINNLISQCWRNNPEERITAQEALNRLQIIQ